MEPPIAPSLTLCKTQHYKTKLALSSKSHISDASEYGTFTSVIIYLFVVIVLQHCSLQPENVHS